jgi:hypothetical protein
MPDPAPAKRDYGIPSDIMATLRRRRLLPALWYVGPLEKKDAKKRPGRRRRHA